MNITVVTGMREFFFPHRIHADALVEGLRVDGAASPPRIPRAPWHSSNAGDAYHDFIFDPVGDTVDLFARYLLETASPNEAQLVLLPFDPLFGEAPNQSADARRLAAVLEHLAPSGVHVSLRPLAWTTSAADRLRAMGREAFGPLTSQHTPPPDPLGPGLPSALDECFARNYTYWAAYLGAALHLQGKTEDLRTPATRTANAFEQAGLKISPELGRDDIVQRVAEVFPRLFA